MSCLQEVDDHVFAPMDDSIIDKVEEILGYKFSDRSLAEDALTLKTFYYPFMPSKRIGRLEILGDSILHNILTINLYYASPDLTPGEITRLRSANTDKEKLGRVAVANGLHRLIRHKEPNLDSLIEEFIRDMDKYPIHSFGLLDPPKALSDVLESLIGAIFVDSNKSSDIAEKIFMRISQPIITDLNTLGKHPGSELNEMCQQLENCKLQIISKWDESKTVDIILNGTRIGTETYSRRKDICLNRATKLAIDKIKKLVRNGDLKLKSTHIDEKSLS